MKDKKRLKSLIIASLLTAVIIGAFLMVFKGIESYPITEKSSVAMGTVISQKIYTEKPNTAVKDIISIVNGLENTISWRKPDSAVAVLNENGEVNNKYLSNVLPDMEKLSEKTDGKFDLTVGKLSRLWSIGEEGERIPNEKEIEAALKTVGSEKLKIGANKITAEKGTFLDLGAIGKGFACDLIYTYLSKTEIEGAIVSVGGSVVAYGNHNPKGDEWKIAVTHPRDEKSYLGVVSLSEGFISTSGDYERYFEKDGKRYHHILDATTGYPSESDLISATVVAKSGILSDALSTAAFLMGSEKAKSLLEEYGAAGILVDKDMNITTVGEIQFEKY